MLTERQRADVIAECEELVRETEGDITVTHLARRVNRRLGLGDEAAVLAVVEEWDAGAE